MKTILNPIIPVCLSFFLLLAMLVGCDFLDPTAVTNPNTTPESLEAADGATVPFLAGVQRRLSQAIEEMGLVHETISDNYDNISTNLGDWPDWFQTILPDDDDGYEDLQQFIALATLTLEEIIPGDDQATDIQKAEVLFLRGLGYILSAESYWGVPIAPDTEALSMQERLNLAIADLDAAVGSSQGSDLQATAHIALARVYRLMGDNTNAKSHAETAIAGGPSDLVYFANYDAQTTTNDVWAFTLTRSLYDMQSLPRLNFLDPKYHVREAGIPVVKMEEAHLILAEVHLSDGNFDAAKQSLADAITIALAHDVGSVRDDDPLNRNNASLPDLPTAQPILVQASPTSPALPGLYFLRDGGTVDIPTISGTSLVAAVVLALPTGSTAENVELLRLVYLARQEIFFAEGRRMTDLGIRRPMNLTEIEQNDVITEGADIGTSIYVPSLVPTSPNLDEIDRFDVQGNTIIMNIDMNQVLADNRNNEYKPNPNDISTALPFSFPF